ncbi:MAG: class I SAM-dependent methyltransferase [Thermoanaerobaculia bacterium]
MSLGGSAGRVASRFEGQWIRHYVHQKLRFDPVYPAALEALRSVPFPLRDIGCGLGILGLYLRENGFAEPVSGIDFDERKIAIAKAVTHPDEGLRFEIRDARERDGFRGSHALLDVLHYFPTAEQQRILHSVAESTPPGAVVVIRDCIRDGSLRYRLTWLQESFSRAIRWLRSEGLNFPSRELLLSAFPAAEFEHRVEPMWGRTPFNNYLFVFRRREMADSDSLQASTDS